MSTELQQRPSRSALNTAMQQTSGGAIAFAPNTFDGLLQVSQMMAASGHAVPKHLRDNVGACMSVAMVAYQNGFNPFLLAADTYSVNDILSYGAKSISAMVNNSPRLEGRLSVALGGVWPKRTCTIRGRIKGDPEVKEWETKAETITTRNSPNWKQQPDQQLAYVAQRNWARIHMSEVTLGLLDSDEASEPDISGPDNARDITTPARPTRADFATTATVVDAETDPEPFTFTTTDGEVLEIDYPQAFVAQLVAALEAAGTRMEIEGIWESNSGQLTCIRAEAAEGAKLADEAHDAYALALDRVHVNGGGAQGAPETPAQVLERIAAELEAATTEADFQALAERLGRTITEAGRADRAAYQAWVKRYDAKLAALRETEG